MVTKRGTNDVHGSARVFITDRKFQSDNISDELAAQLKATGARAIGNQVQGIQDYGAELGGPIVQDKLWLWGSYGRQQVNNLVASGFPDRTTLEGLNFKLNAQLVPENSITAVYSHNDKIKLGRNASITRPPEASWDQSGPTKLYKIEDSHIFSSNFFASASYSRVLGGFQLIAEGQNPVFQDDSGVWHNGYYNYITYRPQTQVNVTPSFFMRTGNVGHEFKAGFVYRDTPIGTNGNWPGGIVAKAGANLGFDQDLVAFTRDRNNQTDQKYYSGYLSDTMTIDKLTVNLGVRYDHQITGNPAGVTPCCRYDTAVWSQVPLTPVDSPASADTTWNDFSPRVGLTYAIGSDNKTLLKASYARFVNQLGGVNSSWNGNALASAAYLYYYWHDNGDHIVQPGEVDFTSDNGFGPNGLVFGSYIDPLNPNNKFALNKTDPNLSAPRTDEFILGIEREVFPAFVVGLSGTFRHFSNFTGTVPLSADGSRVLTPADYNCTVAGPYPVPGGSPATINVCDAKPGVASESRLLTNISGYYQTYWGIDFTAQKRYSDRWMARFAFTYSDWTQHGVGDMLTDPSDLTPGRANDVTGFGAQDGGIVVVSPGAISGAKTGVFINSKWQGTLSAMYTLPLDFNLSSSVFTRQGYPIPYYRQVAGAEGVPGYATSKRYQIGPVDEERLPAVVEWDAGLSKVVKISGLDVTLMADCFNVLNRNTVLQRTVRVRGTGTTLNSLDNTIVEQQNPRIFRFGARLSF